MGEVCTRRRVHTSLSAYVQVVVYIEYHCPMYTMTCSNTFLPFRVYIEWQMNIPTPNLHLDYVSTNYCKELQDILK